LPFPLLLLLLLFEATTPEPADALDPARMGSAVLLLEGCLGGKFDDDGGGIGGCGSGGIGRRRGARGGRCEDMIAF
jgi:hypothetical protein